MPTLLNSVRAFARDEEAATAAEYGLMAALVAGVIIGVVTTLGLQVQGVFRKVGATVGTASGGMK